MPFIQVKLSVNMTEEQKNDLNNNFLNIISNNTGKPKAFIMTNIEDNQTIYMSNEKIDKSAYISVSLLGNISKQTCSVITKEICDLLKKNFDIDGRFVYVSYHPVELWGWNGQMF
ncbi:MAG: hypothetical protein K6C94_02620 [Candidatus Gastranaerophilales bacterium]|nr:hypothetical protein [Candidatus Gastranaerophilales bacterium]